MPAKTRSRALSAHGHAIAEHIIRKQPMPANTCRAFLTAALATAPAKARKRFARAAVLGDALGFTVELQDATQFYVGRQHCKYCARAEALLKLSSQDEQS